MLKTDQSQDVNQNTWAGWAPVLTTGGMPGSGHPPPTPPPPYFPTQAVSWVVMFAMITLCFT